MSDEEFNLLADALGLNDPPPEALVFIEGEPAGVHGPLKPEYAAWITGQGYDTFEKAYGTCQEATAAMLAAFPALTRVRGHYYCHVWGDRAHWWLLDPDGIIVDPTAAQFPSKGAGPYVPWDESQPAPTGPCANCGDNVYDGGTCCSPECHAAYAAYCNNPGAY